MKASGRSGAASADQSVQKKPLRLSEGFSSSTLSSWALGKNRFNLAKVATKWFAAGTSGAAS